MDSRSLKVAFVAMVILTVAAMSVSPLEPGTGSYQSVNGPTTIFQATRAAMLVMLLLAAVMRLAEVHPVPALEMRTTDLSDLSCTMLC